MPGAPARALTLTDRELLPVSRHRSTPQSIALRTEIVLGAAEGVAHNQLARQLATTLPTVLLWRKRYESEGLAGIREDRPRSGRPQQIREKKGAAIDPAPQIHSVLDNYGTHQHPQVRTWFEEHPRDHPHCTPTGASWLNQVERWFAEITRKKIRRGTFHSVRELVKAIQDYIRENNNNPQPFHWLAKANTIIRKVRKYKQISETGD